MGTQTPRWLCKGYQVDPDIHRRDGPCIPKIDYSVPVAVDDKEIDILRHNVDDHLHLYPVAPLLPAVYTDKTIIIVMA
jgi:hypothetical protein